MPHARGRGRELKELQERRKKVHLKTVGSWIALVVCVGSVLVAWNDTTRLVWLAVTPFAVLAVAISIHTEREIDARIRTLVPDSATSAGFMRKESVK